MNPYAFALIAVALFAAGFGAGLLYIANLAYIQEQQPPWRRPL